MSITQEIFHVYNLGSSISLYPNININSNNIDNSLIDIDSININATYQ